MSTQVDVLIRLEEHFTERAANTRLQANDLTFTEEQRKARYVAASIFAQAAFVVHRERLLLERNANYG